MLNSSVLRRSHSGVLGCPCHPGVLSLRPGTGEIASACRWNILSCVGLRVLGFGSLVLGLRFFVEWSFTVGAEKISVVIISVRLSSIHLSDLFAGAGKRHGIGVVP